MKNLLINRALAAKKKKLFSLFLALVASVGTVFAEPVQIGGLYYDLNVTNQTAEVARNSSASGEIIIPSSVTYNSVTYSVTSIGIYAFSRCTGLTSIEIPNSVKSIGWAAFRECTGLTSVTIGNSVTSIGYQAFYECRGLTSVTIPNSVTSIADAAFWGCGLTSVTIPNSVTSIGNSVFTSCNHLISVTIGTGVTGIGDYTFVSCASLTFVTIPNSVKSIGREAFRNCIGLTSVTIPNSVTSIGIDAFNMCTSLTSVTIPNSVISIGERAFSSCSSLTSVTIPNSVTSIGTGAFTGCRGLTSIVVENENMVYDSRNNCNAIINTATNTLIAGCKNTIIPNSVTSIEAYAFAGCGLTSVTIPNSVTSIGDHAFTGCSGLTSVTIPNSVTSIGAYAFEHCTGLTSVTIPNSVTSIGGWAFSGCSGLTSVTIEAETPPTLGDYNAFIGDYPIYVPCNAVNAYKTASKWKVYADRIRGNCASYTVRFLNWDGSVLQSTQVEEGQMPQYTGATPTKPSDSQYSYTFSGWTPQIVAATADATYTATFKSIGDHNITVRLDPSSCSSWTTVRLWAWTDEGNIFDSWPGQIVSLDAEGWYSYTFDEDITSVSIIWNNGTNQTVDIEGVTSSTCYALNSTSGKAITVSVVNCPSVIPTQYTVVFKNWDGSVLQSMQVEEGQMPQYTGATPTKPSDAQYFYTFSGWTPQIVAVTADATYTATYTATPRSQGIEDVLSDQVQCTKFLRGGQIFILRGEKVYSITGQEVK